MDAFERAFLNALAPLCPRAMVESHMLSESRALVLSIQCTCPVGTGAVQRKVTDVDLMAEPMGLEMAAWRLLDEFWGRHAPTLAELAEWGWFHVEEESR